MRKREAGVAADRDDALEAAIARDLELGPGQVGVVLDDQYDTVAVGDVVAIVPHVAREEESRVELRLDAHSRRRCGPVPVALRREHDGLLDRTDDMRMLDRVVRRRQEERELAAPADFALDMDLAAQQTCDLAADRETEAGAAVTAARRPVCLLESLEDQAQLVMRDADAGVLDRELEHGFSS